MKQIALSLITFLLAANSLFAQKTSEKRKWVQLFNGKNLDGWIVKISKHDLDDNFANTFRVKDGKLTVSYDGYKTFDEQYGHIFYKKPYSHYLLAVEYRFVGQQCPGGQGWAYKNSGIMLHCQDPHTMGKDQDFPISIEDQLLGGDSTGERSTCNVCTPGTNIELNGKLFTPHCTNSTSKTFRNEEWVRAEVLVLGDSVIKQIVNGDTVLVYTKPSVGGGNVSNYEASAKPDGKPLTQGFISLQSESHPVEFRKIEIIDLSKDYQPSPKNLHRSASAHTPPSTHASTAGDSKATYPAADGSQTQDIAHTAG